MPSWLPCWRVLLRFCELATRLVKDKLDQLDGHDKARAAFDGLKADMLVQDGALVLPENTFVMATVTK